MWFSDVWVTCAAGIVKPFFYSENESRTGGENVRTSVFLKTTITRMVTTSYMFPHLDSNFALLQHCTVVQRIVTP